MELVLRAKKEKVRWGFTQLLEKQNNLLLWLDWRLGMKRIPWALFYISEKAHCLSIMAQRWFRVR